jgi:hypothetical protein
MRRTLETLLQVQREGFFERFAIGGAVAAAYYVEAVVTEDLDVFAFLKPGAGGLIDLEPLYARLRELGGEPRDEHVVIAGWPVQILPPYSPLVEEAVLAARDCKYEDLVVPVLAPEYLCAIALQTARPKDFARVHSFVTESAVDAGRLKALVERFSLVLRWREYERRYV